MAMVYMKQLIVQIHTHIQHMQHLMAQVALVITMHILIIPEEHISVQNILCQDILANGLKLNYQLILI